MAFQVGMVSLGCPKNQMDAELLLAKLRDAGIRLTADPGTADVVIVNTGRIVRSAGARSTDVRGVAPFPNLVTSLLAFRHKRCLPDKS